MSRFIAAIGFACLVALGCSAALDAGTNAMQQHKARVDAAVDAAS